MLSRAMKDIGTIGSIIAVVVSFTQWQSILWAFLHGLCGWAYLIFWHMGWADSVPF